MLENKLLDLGSAANRNDSAIILSFWGAAAKTHHHKTLDYIGNILF
jgi:hypothetical protein